MLGVGLSARFSTGIVVAQLLFSHRIIDQLLFGSLIAASTISIIFVPIASSMLTKKWST